MLFCFKGILEPSGRLAAEQPREHIKLRLNQLTGKPAVYNVRIAMHNKINGDTAPSKAAQIHGLWP